MIAAKRRKKGMKNGVASYDYYDGEYSQNYDYGCWLFFETCDLPNCNPVVASMMRKNGTPVQKDA